MYSLYQTWQFWVKFRYTCDFRFLRNRNIFLSLVGGLEDKKYTSIFVCPEIALFCKTQPDSLLGHPLLQGVGQHLLGRIGGRAGQRVGRNGAAAGRCRTVRRRHARPTQTGQKKVKHSRRGRRKSIRIDS